MGSLEESSPDSHGIFVAAIVLEVRASCWLIPVVAGVSLFCLRCNYRVIHDGNADPKWTTIVLATGASPFASSKWSSINFIVELLWIGNLCCIYADAIIVFSVKCSIAIGEAIGSTLCTSSCSGIFLIFTHM